MDNFTENEINSVNDPNILNEASGNTKQNESSITNGPEVKFPHRGNPYHPVSLLSHNTSSHIHRTNSHSYYHGVYSSGNKKSYTTRAGTSHTSEGARLGYVYKKKKLTKRLDTNIGPSTTHGSRVGKLSQMFRTQKVNSMAHNKLMFITPYDKCSDFSNYKNFLKLNLKFLKQNYKFKDAYEKEDIETTAGNANSSTNIMNPNIMMNMTMTPNASANAIMKNQSMMSHNMVGSMNNLNMSGNVNSHVNNLTNLNAFFLYVQNLNKAKAMMMNNASSTNVNMNNIKPVNTNLSTNTIVASSSSASAQQTTSVEVSNNPLSSLPTPSCQTTTGAEPSTSSPTSDQYIQNMMFLNQLQFFQNQYLQAQSELTKSNSNVNININNHVNTNVNININSTQIFNSNNNINMNNLYYETLRLQPYTFIRDPKVIEENNKTGRYLTGIIRINKCHTHGYITVSGLVNDILIRGNRNLNQSIHLDEVIVELFPMVCWKPFLNKKIRKISLVMNEDDEEEKTEIKKMKKIAGSDCFTDIEGEVKECPQVPSEAVKVEVEAEAAINPNYNSDNAKSSDVYSTSQLIYDNGYKFKENFNSLEERLKYINKAYNLRPEGRIVKIIKSPNIEKAQIVRIINEKSLIFACPIDENLPKIFIKMKKFRRVEFIKKFESDSNFRNKYFLVKIVGWALNFKCPKGIIVNEIGNCGDVEVETEVLLRTYEIDYTHDYPQQAIDELSHKFGNFRIDEILADNAERVDLRNEIIFTIDPAQSKDLDDAISVKMINEDLGLLEIGVHIADPSYFVTKDSLLDKEAMNRTTTVYLVHKSIPMLPRVLSENLCSLLPYQERLSFSCVFRIYFDGALDTTFTPKFFLSAMKSSAKWNYDIVQRIIDGEEIRYDDLSIELGTKPVNEEIFNEMCDKIKMLYKLTKLVRSQRIESGSLSVENDEIAFDLQSETAIPVGFRIKKRKESNNLIEELMLIANKLCAEFLYENMKEYAMIRKHSYLNDNKFQEIQRYISINKLAVDYEEPQELNKMLLKLKETNENKYICVQHKLKNFMQRAEYVISGHHEFDDLKHSALNFDLYTHFTSPIRRYPDIIVHRQLKKILEKKIQDYDYEKDFSCYECYIDHFNEKYINGKLLSSKCQKVFLCIYLKSVVKKIYTALIVDISKSKRGAGVNPIQTSGESSATVSIFIPELNLEIDWKKEDNSNILSQRYNTQDNSLTIDFKNEESTVSNHSMKTFDEIKVHVRCVDSIPIDLKCEILLN